MSKGFPNYSTRISFGFHLDVEAISNGYQGGFPMDFTRIPEGFDFLAQVQLQRGYPDRQWHTNQVSHTSHMSCIKGLKFNKKILFDEATCVTETMKI